MTDAGIERTRKPPLRATAAQAAALRARFNGSPPIKAAPPPPPCAPAPPRPRPSAAAARHRLRTARDARAGLILATLVERFPECFRPFDDTPLPLKIGIDKDIVSALGCARHDVINVLTAYTGSAEYFSIMIEGASRIDLNGDHAGSVSARSARYSAKMLKEATATRPTKEGGPLSVT
jgi:ProP effector